MTSKQLLLHKLYGEFIAGNSVHIADNSIGYDLLGPDSGYRVISTIRKSATRVRRIPYGGEEMFPDFAGHVESPELCDVWSVEFDGNYKLQIITYNI
jgi:hypothetical protein